MGSSCRPVVSVIFARFCWLASQLRILFSSTQPNVRAQELCRYKSDARAIEFFVQALRKQLAGFAGLAEFFVMPAR